MTKIFLKKNQERRIRSGHPWVFSNEIWKVEGSEESGEIVEVLDFRGKFLGIGYYNPHSLISIRLLSREKEEIDKNFFIKHIQKAQQFRERIYPQEKSYRLIFSEGDFLPGLIVDKYENFLVIQVLTLGMERLKEKILEALQEIMKPQGIYEKSDLTLRHLEGLKEEKGLLFGEIGSPLMIEENGLRFLVDIEQGQKTGWFFDQRENRLAMSSYAKGARVLDCFCYTGAFSIYAAKAGVTAVKGIESKDTAIDLACKNAKLNRVSAKVRFEIDDVFEALRKKEEKREEYDLIILDPPSFAKSKKEIEGAIRGYKEINLRAMKILKSGGILVTWSCSYHIENQLFKEILLEAGRDAHCVLQLLGFRHQSMDHPVLLAAKETEYLKCAILKVEK